MESYSTNDNVCTGTDDSKNWTQEKTEDSQNDIYNRDNEK